MEKRVCGIAHALLLVLVVVGEIMVVNSEGRICWAKSRKYQGLCYFKTQIVNCSLICKRERFNSGKCKGGRCYCWRRCGPVVTGRRPPPPIVGPPDVGPPNVDVPDVGPPEDGPPSDDKPKLLFTHH
ncbi:defensin-like protein [Striga asiatica]|uniref:Defensin-like protein n=1 Tax=Striga asiatica TaxID=4170 RepID=A0A5A7P5L2_STRAF|nr:defensin-like protein [Striga asiatica]